MRIAKRKCKELEHDVGLLQLEIQSRCFLFAICLFLVFAPFLPLPLFFCAFKRPEMKELRECQSQLKKYEKLVKKHNLL